MAVRPEQWPQATSELLPHTLFRLASQYPDLVYSEYPLTNNIADGYRKITYKDVANAVHAAAWWIEQNVGKPSKDDGSETIVYMGPNDLCYAILVLSSVMTGYKMLFPTPRYGVEAITALITKVNGSVMLVPSDPFPVVEEVLAKRSMRTFDFPSIEHFLATEVTPYLFTKTFEAHKHEPLVCLHTSGTTGFPKPVIWTHDWLDSVAGGFYLPAPAGSRRLDDLMLGPRRRLLNFFPAFHASGIICALFFQLLLGTTVVYVPARVTPGEYVDAVADALDAFGEEDKVDVVGLPLPHAEYLGANAAVLDRISRRSNTILYSGGALSQSAGDAIAAKLQLVNQFASTELALWTQLQETDANPAEAEWSYVKFHPDMHIRFIPGPESNEGTLYEAIMVRNQDKAAYIQPFMKLSPNLNQIPLGDMFTRHPHNPEKWKHAGRSDDLLNFLTSETFHPVNAEQRINTHPGVAEAVLVGTRRPKASLIVRLNDGASLDSVWAVIDSVNNDNPVYARVERHMVLVVAEPFLRTAKGTVQKKALIGLYERQLDELYELDGSFVPVK